MLKKLLILAAGVLVTVLIVEGLEWHHRIQTHLRLEGFALAEILPTVQSNGMTKWDAVIELRNDLSVSIRAGKGEISDVTLHYSDSDSTIDAYPSPFGFRPTNLRIDHAKKCLYILECGTTVLGKNGAQLVIYDLQKRERLNEVWVDEADIP